MLRAQGQAQDAWGAGERTVRQEQIPQGEQMLISQQRFPTGPPAMVQAWATQLTSSEHPSLPPFPVNIQGRGAGIILGVDDRKCRQ